MYVCVCNAVTEREISASVAHGANSFQSLKQQLGVATCCGKCARAVRQQLRDEVSTCAGSHTGSCGKGG